jgi:hypothetical protein
MFRCCKVQIQIIPGCSCLVPDDTCWQFSLVSSYHLKGNVNLMHRTPVPTKSQGDAVNWATQKRCTQRQGWISDEDGDGDNEETTVTSSSEADAALCTSSGV